MHRDEIYIAEPCHADWNEMTGDERKRFCGSCKKHVHDLNALTEAEARTLVTTEKDLCVQFRSDRTGRLPFASTRAPIPVALAAVATLFATPAFASGTQNAGFVERMQAWWNTASEVVVTPIEKASSVIPEVKPVTPTSVIPEVKPVRPVEVVVEPVDTEHMPMTRGRMAFRRKPTTTTPKTP